MTEHHGGSDVDTYGGGLVSRSQGERIDRGESLGGGFLDEVVRIGSTVRRPCGS
ncbi:MAG: hypothetical protein ACRDYA_10640 [Egibacteraceae bacterium]